MQGHASDLFRDMRERTKKFMSVRDTHFINSQPHDTSLQAQTVSAFHFRFSAVPLQPPPACWWAFDNCRLLDIFGWAFDREGPKSDTFSKRVAALGVVFNLDPTLDRRLEVQNTEKRLQVSVGAIDRILSSKQLGKRDALVLRGSKLK